MKTIELAVELRSDLGKGPAKRLRGKGRIPAILYGPKRLPLPLAVSEKEWGEKISTLEGAHLIHFTGDLPELQECVALVKETQFHPVTQRPLHIDFYEVNLAQTIRVRVPLHFVGKPKGAVLGGILQPLQREIEIECLPMEIPEFVEVDVTGLGIHDAIHVSEVQLPHGLKAVYHEDVPVVTVLAPTVEPTAGGTEAPVEGEGSGQPKS